MTDAAWIILSLSLVATGLVGQIALLATNKLPNPVYHAAVMSTYLFALVVFFFAAATNQDAPAWAAMVLAAAFFAYELAKLFQLAVAARGRG